MKVSERFIYAYFLIGFVFAVGGFYHLFIANSGYTTITLLFASSGLVFILGHSRAKEHQRKKNKKR